MKDWFPLTSYEFYAYLTAGMLTIAAVDRVFWESTLADAQNWTIISGVFWAAVAYLTGHIIAIPSSGLLQEWLARHVFAAPTEILLGIRKPRLRERFATTVLGAREYAPFPQALQKTILAKAASLAKADAGSVDAETAYHIAFPYARSSADSAVRLDNFINQYGLCRNVSFAAFVAAAILLPYAMQTDRPVDYQLGWGALVLAVGLFGRFLKFYSAYAREVLRTFNKLTSKPDA